MKKMIRRFVWLAFIAAATASQAGITDLEKSFKDQDYAKVLKQAKLAAYQQGTPEHDSCLYLMGGSYFYLGKFGEAKPLLDEHMKLYPKSFHAMDVAYFRASNLTRLQKWLEASDQLSDFLENYPDPKTNIYMPMALYDRANCALVNEETEYGVTLLKRLVKDFPKSVVLDMAYALRGNFEESQGNYDSAEAYYKKALAVAEERNNRHVAAESLNYLIGMLGVKHRKGRKNPRLKDALPYFDKMWKEHQDSPYWPQTVVFSRPAMKAVGRGDEQLTILKKVIATLANKKMPVYLEECINAHTRAFMEEGKLDSLVKLYLNFPGIEGENKRGTLLLKMALLGELEEQLERLPESEAVAAKKQIAGLYNELKNTRVEDLSNFALLRLGLHLREDAMQSKKALSCFLELIGRSDEYGKPRAKLEAGEILSLSTEKMDQEKAMTILTELYKSSMGDQRMREKALYAMVKALHQSKSWELLEKESKRYLDSGYRRHSADVTYLLALSFDKSGRLNDALLHYGMCYSRYTGYLRVSSRAIRRVMEILWERNKPKGAKVGEALLKKDDRQTAYDIGKRFLKSTHRIRTTNKKMTDDEKETWDVVEKLAKKYAMSGQVVE